MLKVCAKIQHMLPDILRILYPFLRTGMLKFASWRYVYTYHMAKIYHCNLIGYVETVIKEGEIIH